MKDEAMNQEPQHPSNNFQAVRPESMPAMPPSPPMQPAQSGPGPKNPAALPFGMEPYAPSTQTPTPSPHRRNYVLFAAAGLAVGLGAGFLFAQIDLTSGSAKSSTALIDAVSGCRLEGATGIELGDGGQSLTMNSEGEDYYAEGAGYEDIQCVLRGTGMPDSVSSRMDNTRALDGRQSAEWEGISASWSYHPDSGSNVVLEIMEPVEK